MTAARSGPAPLPDAEARAIATTRFEPNIVVTAGAGTGKTALLVERALNLIGSGRCGLPSIAAITFTEKAAAELRQRLADGLEDLRRLASAATGPALAAAAPGRPGAGDPPPAGEARRAWEWLIDPRGGGMQAAEVATRALEALQRIDAASVTTIHAFCADILRRHPLAAGVDPAFAIDEGPAADRIFDMEWERYLEEETGERAARPEVWRRALGRPGALAMIRAMARRLAGFATPAADLREAAAPASMDLLGPVLQPLLASIDDILRRATGMNPNMEACLRSCAAFLSAALEGGPPALAAVRAAWTLDDLQRKSDPAPGKKLGGVDAAIVAETAARARRLVQALSAVDDGAVEALLAAARPAAARCRERVLQSGLVTFDGLLRLTRDLLAGHPGIRRGIAARHGTLLVDEFQDTDPLQYEILFYLAETGDEPADDAWRARLAPGRLFIVGDPKQSIYRFRGADIEAYNRAVTRLRDCGGTCVTLSTSFRSPAGIVDPINRLFGGWIGPRTPEEAASEPEYHPIVPARAAASGPDSGVTIWSVDRPGAAAARRRAEAEAIAAWIAGRAAAAREGGDAPYRRYAILMRALTSAALYVDALRRAGIPFVVEGGKNFYERREVGDLISFLRAASNPGDGAAVLAVLRGPLGAVPDAELARFVAGGGRLERLEAAGINGDSFPNVRRAALLLDRFRARMPGRPADATVSAALDETPLLLLHAACFDGGQRVANLRKLATRAQSLARQGLSLEAILEELEDRQGERTEGESPLADETIDAVRVLTVHKAKGLEYEVVILPDLGRQPGAGSDRPDAEIAVLRDPASLAVRLRDGTRNTAWIVHEEAARLHDRAEEKRVFYVACTRARESLILINSSRRGRAPWRDALAALGYAIDGGYPADGPLAAGIEHRIRHAARLERGAAEARPAASFREAAERWRETVAALRAGTAPPLRWPAGAGDESISLEDGRTGGGERRPAAGAGRDAARAAGVAVHAALQAWAFDDPGRLRELLRREARRAVLEDGSAGSRLTEQVTTLGEEILDGFLASPLPERLAAVRVLGREVPILMRDVDGTTWIGACDLIFEDPAGDVVVADYKTDRLEGDAPAAARRYHPQMSIYLQAVRRALPRRRVRGEILFLRDGLAVGFD